MRRILLVIALCNAAAPPHVVRGDTRDDGQLLSAKARAPLASYESLDDFGRGYFSRDLYEQARAQQEFDVLDIRYASDGLAVPACWFGRRIPPAGHGRPSFTTAAAPALEDGSTI